MSEAPKTSDHPVDVLKWCAEQMGLEIDPEVEARMRSICDEPVPAVPFAFEFDE